MSNMTANEKSRSTKDPPDPHVSRSELLGEALDLYIQKIKRENNESRSWIGQPNNLISVVAIVLSLVSLGYALLKDHYDGIDKNFQSLSTAVADLTKLDSDVLTATLTDPQRLATLGLVINNRRIALLAEADRLIGDLRDRAPVAQLAVLGPAYVQVNEYMKAIKYFSMTAERASSPTLQSEAWRSMALAYEYMGSDYDQNVRDAFARAAQIFPNPKDIGSIILVATIYDQWAQFEAARANYADGLSRFADARRFATKLPCPAPRSDFIAKLGHEVTQALASYHANDPDQAAEVVTLASTNACS
jgi:hypothetical protein